MTKIKWITILALIIGALVLFFGFRTLMPSGLSANASYTVIDRWELPEVLVEVSGIAWLAADEMAAVQDEDGIIFIYDLKKREIIDEIKFAKAGDYEGIAVRGDDAYVLRSDGVIFEVIDFRKDTKKVSSFKTPFSLENNMETLGMDTKRDRLLIMPKDRDTDSDRFKGMYAVSLDSKKTDTTPVFSIDMGAAVLKRFRKSTLSKTFRPSDMAIHPKTGEFFILEGSKPKLLILSADGTPKKAYGLDKKRFPQPEGITFSSDGALYISSEGKKSSAGTITQLRFSE